MLKDKVQLNEIGLM